MIAFENTEIAFKNKTDRDLKRAYRLFKLMRKSWLVRSGEVASKIAFALRLPVSKLIRNTIFRQFCGGTSITDCKYEIEKLSKFGIGTILDYSVEGKLTEQDLDKTRDEIIRTIRLAEKNKDIPFAVFKPTGLARVDLLEKMSSDKNNLNAIEQYEIIAFIARVDSICQAASDAKIKLFIDAEDYSFQTTIDHLAEKMFQKYNQSNVIIYTTVQMYRHDRLEYLGLIYDAAMKGNYKVGVKLVRGAYMEKERERADKNNYASPIYNCKEDTDSAFNLALEFLIKRIETFAICAGTHNEESTNMLIAFMEQEGINSNDARVYFAQLLGMSDHITYNLAHNKFNVVKYVPYGPIKEVMPYLLRRAQENSSVADQTSRELKLIEKELLRRK